MVILHKCYVLGTTIAYYMGSVLAAIPRKIFAGQGLGDLPKTSDNFLI